MSLLPLTRTLTVSRRVELRELADSLPGPLAALCTDNHTTGVSGRLALSMTPGAAPRALRGELMLQADSAVLESLGLDAPRQDALGALLIQSAMRYMDAAAEELGLACEGCLRLQASRFARRGAAMWRTARAGFQDAPGTAQTSDAAAIASIAALFRAHGTPRTT